MAMRVVGLDVGSGYTKQCYRDETGKLVMKAFRSVAVPTNESSLAKASRSAGVGASIMTVEIDGSKFDVDVSENATIIQKRVEWNESSDFPERAEYRALIHAALASTGFSHVDVLVVGLPLHTFQRYRKEIIGFIGGTVFSSGGQITVGEVRVVPQGVGAMLTLRAEGEGKLAYLRSALVDVGQFTSDWIVSQNLAIDFERSGGRPGGASHVYRTIAEGIALDLGETFDQFDQIELSLRTGEPLLVYGAPMDLKPHLGRANHVALQTARAIQAKLGTTHDLTFVLAGGGGHLYRDALAEVFPRNRIVELADARFRNVVGFVLFGEQSNS
jgi:plasmid segregation protein ParM